jgi:hypothetical protein
VNYKISGEERKVTKMLGYEWHEPILSIVGNTKFSPFLISQTHKPMPWLLSNIDMPAFHLLEFPWHTNQYSIVLND